MIQQNTRIYGLWQEKHTSFNYLINFLTKTKQDIAQSLIFAAEDTSSNV